jgi:hypothetical protein
MNRIRRRDLQAGKYSALATISVPVHDRAALAGKWPYTLPTARSRRDDIRKDRSVDSRRSLR